MENDRNQAFTDYATEATRVAREQFCRGIARVIERTPAHHEALPHAFTAEEQAAVLRKMADQIERAARGNPVARSKARNAWPRRSFFHGGRS